MEIKKGFGFLRLAKKSLAVFTASIAALTGNKSFAVSTFHNPVDGNNNLNHEQIVKRLISTKLVLKLNPNRPEKNLLVMHQSHSSHSSHMSGSSGTPRDSSNRKGATEDPSNSPHSVPAYAPSEPVKSPNPVINDTAPSSEYLTTPLGSRILYKGLQGSDVEELQKILLKLKYDIIVSGYFGDKTEDAIIKFQKANELKPDGQVDKKIVDILQKK